MKTRKMNHLKKHIALYSLVILSFAIPFTAKAHVSATYQTNISVNRTPWGVQFFSQTIQPGMPPRYYHRFYPRPPYPMPPPWGMSPRYFAPPIAPKQEPPNATLTPSLPAEPESSPTVPSHVEEKPVSASTPSDDSINDQAPPAEKPLPVIKEALNPAPKPSTYQKNPVKIKGQYRLTPEGQLFLLINPEASKQAQ